MQMTQNELNEVVELHRKWLNGVEGGVQANLSGANLSGANLSRANLREANLREADLRWATLREANLREANLREANLREANLSRANLSEANLREANLSEANLHRANLREATLREANLREANLSRANLREANLSPYQICPEAGSFTAYKKVQGGVVLVLLIPSDARRTSNLVNRKCRASKVRVLNAWNADGSMANGEFRGKHYNETIYRTGETVESRNQIGELAFNDDLRVDCAEGIHFFITRKEAEEWLQG